jgi:hypothetical protein
MYIRFENFISLNKQACNSVELMMQEFATQNNNCIMYQGVLKLPYYAKHSLIFIV